jgi:hypothetical protein
MADVIQDGKTMPQIPEMLLLPFINRLWKVKPQLRTDGAQLQMDFPLLPVEFALLPMEFMPPRMEKALLHSDLHKIWPF